MERIQYHPNNPVHLLRESDDSLELGPNNDSLVEEDPQSKENPQVSMMQLEMNNNHYLESESRESEEDSPAMVVAGENQHVPARAVGTPKSNINRRAPTLLDLARAKLEGQN